MPIVGRNSEIATPDQEQVARRELQQRAVADFRDWILVAVVAVGISHECCGRGDEGDRRPGFAPGRADEEGDEVLAGFILGASHMSGIEATGQIGRYSPGKIGFPAAVVEIVVVEMDGAIEIRPVAPVKGLAIPAGAHHASGGKIDRFSMQPIGGEIGDVGRADALGEIPGGDQALIWVGNSRRLDLAIVALSNDQSSGRMRRSQARRTAGPAGAAVAGQLSERSLAHLDLAAGRVIARLNPIPLSGPQLLAGSDQRVADAQSDIARRPDNQGEAGLVVPPAEEQLLAFAWRRRPDIGCDGEAPESIQGSGGRHADVGTGMDRLAPARVCAGDGATDRSGLEAGPLRAVVAADEAQDLGSVGGGTGLAAYLETDGLAGPDRHAVGVADDLQHGATRSPGLGR